MMPEGLEQTAGRFAHLDITQEDLNGNLSGSLKVDAVSGPFIGKIYGHHMSLILTSSGLSGPDSYGMEFEGTIRGASIDGTLVEIGTSQWRREPLNYELSLTPESGED